MTGKKSYKIQVSCKINLSEDPSKIKTAVLNVFPGLEISVDDQKLIGKSDDISSLSNISQAIHTKITYHRILTKNTKENSTWFYLNKQAAFVNTVALCSESDESPLGPIKVVLETDDIENTIQTLIC